MPASASALVETSHDETAVGTHSSTATCPLGSHIVSGGGWVHLSSAGHQLPLNGSGRSGNGWSVTGLTHDHSFPFTVTAYAYCGVNDLHLTTVTGSPGTGTPRATAAVSCSSGNAVSGGGAMTATYGYMSAFAKSGNGWRTAADSRFDGGSSGTLPTSTIATVNCTPERYVLSTAQQSSPILANHIGSAVATCPFGTKLVSGGVQAGGTSPDDYAYTWYSRADLKHNAWMVDAGAGPLAPTTATAYAYCIRLPDTAITTSHVKSKTRRASFSFRGTAGEGVPSFQCSLDRKPLKGCSSPATYKSLKVGQHVFSVRAVDPARRVDPTPASKKFTIKKKKKKK